MKLNKNDMQQHIAAIELTEMLCGKPCDICKFYGQHPKCMPVHNAEKIAAAGYRKASEVARQTVEAIKSEVRKKEQYVSDLYGYGGYMIATTDLENIISRYMFDTYEEAELKKKYTKSEGAE